MSKTDKSAAKERFLTYVKICERAEQMGICDGDRADALMDIESADQVFHLRLEEWLAAGDFDFAHDFGGIRKNIVRNHFPATNFGLFLPRFASTTG